VSSIADRVRVLEDRQAEVERVNSRLEEAALTTARGLEPAMAYYFLLDRTARGRQEEGEGEHWLRRHDEYDTGRH